VNNSFDDPIDSLPISGYVTKDTIETYIQTHYPHLINIPTEEGTNQIMFMLFPGTEVAYQEILNEVVSEKEKQLEREIEEIEEKQKEIEEKQKELREKKKTLRDFKKRQRTFKIVQQQHQYVFLRFLFTLKSLKAKKKSFKDRPIKVTKKAMTRSADKLIQIEREMKNPKPQRKNTLLREIH